VALPARAAGLAPHVVLDRAKVLSFVNDGPRQTVAFVLNCQEVPLRQLPVTIHLPRQPIGAYSDTQDPLPFTLDGNAATVALDMETIDGRIVVFRFAEP